MAISSSNWAQSGVHERRTNAGTLTLNFDDATADLTADLNDVADKVAKAVNRAVKKTARWLRTHSMRDLSKELNIKQAPLKNRFIVATDPKKPGEAKIWIGLLAIAAHDIGRATQNQSGVRVGKHQFDGSFYRAVYGSEEKVYIRARRNRIMQHDVVRENRRRNYRPLSNPKLKGRFPVQVVGIDIQEPADRVIQRYEARVNQRYREILEHELKFAIELE
ncbi:hypothetical protein [Vibrio parahaemolyticus]|uniref:hypothetical protein n=1 Tax=Vibrio parahaemolyticus TaxID=670 RepID=UPI00111F3784|nr:hypothetical protein [Vibrio parahaemolyticus]TOP74101.1 hypothetical protein CGH10_22230 [Vibrio parahaemolyticus]TPA69941.1 hypothetical protein DXJ77_23495 [Vibrio parahaemolyticus]